MTHLLAPRAPNCSICDSKDDAQPHFGGVSCRKCAAFFRRCIHSKKTIIKCSCDKREENSHPCRHCRMLRCLKAGLTPDKVQRSRDKTSTRSLVKMAPPMAVSPSVSLLTCRILPRDTPNVCTAISNWSDLDKKRNMLDNQRFETMNIYELSCLTKSDCFHILQLFESLFPQMRGLGEFDKDTMIKNMLPKWVILETCIHFDVNYDEWMKVDSEELDKLIVDFYGTAIPEDRKPDDSQLIRAFRPYWDGFYGITAPRIQKLKLDKFEYSALFLMLLFDQAHTNISEEAASMCETIRNVLLRELKRYQVDQNCEEVRFYDTVDTLSVMERAEEKYREEILVCELNHVQLSEEFKEIMKISNI